MEICGTIVVIPAQVSDAPRRAGIHFVFGISFLDI